MSTDQASPAAVAAPVDLKSEVAKLFSDVMAAATATAAVGTPGTLGWLKVLVDLFEGAEQLVANHAATEAEFKALVSEFEDQFETQFVAKVFHGGGVLQRVENFAAGQLLPKLVGSILGEHKAKLAAKAAAPAATTTEAKPEPEAKK